MKPSSHLSRMVFAIVLLMMAITTTLLPPGTVADGADLRLRPNDGPVGSAANARGRDFPPGAEGVITWEDDPTVLAEFTADDAGDFEVTITVPDVPPGTYRVVATSGDISTNDEFEVEGEGEDDEGSAPVATSTPPAWINEDTTPAPSPELIGNLCTGEPTRHVDVASSADLESALADAQPGDRITIADGTYTGNFVLEASGTQDQRIELCGSANAIIDGGGWEHSGYALHITGDYITNNTLEVMNAQKGVVLDGANHVVLSELDVHTIGHEAVHFRTHSSDNVIQLSKLHDTGLDNEKFGEGVYVGSAVSNWGRYTDGDPDRSNRNMALNNTFWNTSSESIDIKEGTEGGLVEGNVFDGSGLTGADSWVDVKGNDDIIRHNVGTSSPEDGFQTHVINDMAWGSNNVFTQNIATVDGSGYGFYIHSPDTTSNTVACDNEVTGAESGFTNLPEGCNEQG